MSDFGSAFNKARSAGRKTFSWQGKSYTTETKEEADKKALANHPAPPARPQAADKPDASEASVPNPPNATHTSKGGPAQAGVDQANATTSKSVSDANDEVRKAKEKHAEAVKRLAR